MATLNRRQFNGLVAGAVLALGTPLASMANSRDSYFRVEGNFKPDRQEPWYGWRKPGWAKTTEYRFAPARSEIVIHHTEIFDNDEAVCERRFESTDVKDWPTHAFQLYNIARSPGTFFDQKDFMLGGNLYYLTDTSVFVKAIKLHNIGPDKCQSQPKKTGHQS